MPVTTVERMALIQAMKDVFQKAAEGRKTRQEFVSDPLENRYLHQVPAYVLFEREAMLGAVNAERARRGLAPVEVTKIDRVERLACGHVDYASKYPLYCAEIALGEDEPQA